MGKNRVKGIVVEIGGDTIGLNKALDGTNKKINSTQSNLKDVERLLKLDPTNTKLLEQKQRLLGEAIAETEEKLQTLNKAYEQNADSVQNYDKWKEAHDPILQKIDETKKKLKEQEKTLSEMQDTGSKAYKLFRKEMDDTASKLEDLKKQEHAVNEEFGNPISVEQLESLQREIAETELSLSKMKEQAGKSFDGLLSKIKDTQRELREVDKLLDLNPDSIEMLEQKQQLLTYSIEDTEQAIKKMEDEYDRMLYSAQGGVTENEKAFRELERQIEFAKINLKNLKEQAEITDKKLSGIDDQSLKNVENAAEQAADALEGAGKEAATFGDILKAEAIVEGAKGIISALKDVTEETKEYRKIMGSLDVSSEAAGYSAEETQEAYKKLYGVLADDQSAATTLANLQALGLSQEKLLELIDNTVGGWARYGDSIPIDGLAEAVNETAKTGQVTGVLADILNWGAKEGETYGNQLKDLAEAEKLLYYAKENDATITDRQISQLQEHLGLGDVWDKSVERITDTQEKQLAKLEALVAAGDAWNNSILEGTAAEDQFNIALQQCSTEEERLNLIMQAMADQGLAAAGEKWRENNSAMVESNETAADLQEQMALIGEKIEPLVTRITGFVVQALEWFNSLDTGTQNFILATVAIIAALGPVGVAVGGVSKIIEILSGTKLAGLSTAFGKITGTVLPGVQNAFTSTFSFIAANPIVLLVGAIVALVALIATKGDEIQGVLQKVDDFLQGIFVKDWTEVFGPVLGDILNAFFANLKNIWDSIKQIFSGIIDFIRGVFTLDWERAWRGVVDIFGGLFKGLETIAKAPINAIIGLLNGAISGFNILINGANKLPGVNISTIGKIPYLANGGEVLRGSAIVGEAGPELLTVLGDRTIVQPLSSNPVSHSTHLGAVYINVYGSPGQDVHELAEIVMEEMQHAYGREEAALA